MTIRHTGLKKVYRDGEVMKFIKNNPKATLREVGLKFGITPQMVFQIKKES
jgi:DNA-directed RNA polymerase sigma subunit (sigma70/sigma32)